MRRRRRVTVLVALVALVLAGALAYALPRSAPPAQPVPNQAFRSAPASQAPAVVWAVGDGADGGEAARVLSRRIAADRPDRLLYLGDVYKSGSSADFRDDYQTVYGRLARVTAPTPGNHEWPAHPDGYDTYWRGKTNAATPPWYAFRVGGWRVISLNSEAPHTPSSPQLRWLRRELRKAPGTCTLAFWHRPLMSTGKHGDQPDVAPLWNALRGHASVVLNGHDHNLQRMRPRDGLVELVAGAGGKSHYDLSGDPRRVFGDDRQNGALRLELRLGVADIRFDSSAGTVLDRSSVRCERR